MKNWATVGLMVWIGTLAAQAQSVEQSCALFKGA